PLDTIGRDEVILGIAPNCTKLHQIALDCTNCSCRHAKAWTPNVTEKVGLIGRIKRTIRRSVCRRATPDEAGQSGQGTEPWCPRPDGGRVWPGRPAAFWDSTPARRPCRL